MKLMRHRPIKRSRLRLTAGKWWFTGKRYLRWMTNNSVLATNRSPARMPNVIFQHATPLMRQLRNVDMWLQSNKVINLSIAAKKLDGLILKPGETFSYWRTIGKPTKRKGYVDGMVLYYGSYKTGVGGGLCQMSNLIYWMTLHTPLTVTERHRHSYDVFPDAGRTQPFGSGATCAYNYLDLQIHNSTEVPFQLSIRLTEDHLVGEWLCTEPTKFRYEVYEKEHLMASKPWGGYVRSNQIHRHVFHADGEWLEDQYITSNEALMMYSPLLEQK